MISAVNPSYRTVQDQLRTLGIVISKRGQTHRINFFSGFEDTAYYTDSLADALDKGVAMERPTKTRIAALPAAARTAV